MITQILSIEIAKALTELYSVTEQSIQFQKTRKDFEGDITLVVFPLLRASKKGPEQTADEIGNYLKENVSEVTNFNVVKGFLNLEIAKEFWFNQFVKAYNIADYGVVSYQHCGDDINVLQQFIDNSGNTLNMYFDDKR